jgi:hypothetical protein
MRHLLLSNLQPCKIDQKKITQEKKTMGSARKGMMKE